MTRRYGSSPWHLGWHVAALLLCGYALVQILGLAGGGSVLLWLALAVLLHDAILWPLGTVLDRGAQETARRAVNHVRVPAGLWLLLGLVFLPVISNEGEGAYRRVSGQPGFEAGAGTWLLAGAALFAVSGLLWLGRSARARRSRPSP